MINIHMIEFLMEIFYLIQHPVSIDLMDSWFQY